MSTFYTWDAANLFCGDTDPTKSKHLTIQELQLPNMGEMYQDHHPGGSNHQIEISTGFNKLEASFKLLGFDPDLLKLFGLHSTIRHTYTAYQVVTDRRTGKKIENKAIIEGRLGKVEADAFQKGSLLSTSYSINEIMRFELYHDKQEICYFDFFTNTWRVGGVDENSATNQILRIV